MNDRHQIRADFDKDTINLDQAYSPDIANPALSNNKFVDPFSFNRMTWIKPSYLWLMHRSNWGKKNGQERILAIKVKRNCFEKAIALGVLTSYEQQIHKTYDAWKNQFDKALVHIQWDTERTIRGAPLQIDSIQIGISRHLIQEYVNDWIVKIVDYTELTYKISKFLALGQIDNAKRLLPAEKVYPLPESINRYILLND